MFRHSLFTVLIVGVLLSVATKSSALDGRRKGFVLGIGTGGGLVSLKESSFNREGERQSQFALMTDFKIGYAPSNQLAIYWMSKVAWFGRELEFNTGPFTRFTQSYTVANGVGGLGLAYYLQPKGPSPYLTGGVGFSSWATPFEEGTDAFYGFGLALGAGYEFSKHWSFEGNLTLGRQEDNSSSYSIKTLAVRFTINVLAY